MLAQPGVDAVDVVTPNYLHAEIAIAALRAGKDVLLEKPMATTADDCDALLAAERDTGCLISVGHEFRQSEQWGRIKTLIDDDAIGDPLFLNINLFRNVYRSGAGSWRYDPARVGSWLLEEAVHIIGHAQHGDEWIRARAHDGAVVPATRRGARALPGFARGVERPLPIAPKRTSGQTMAPTAISAIAPARNA